MAVWVRYAVPVQVGANGGNQNAWTWGSYEEIVPPCPANFCRAGGVGLNNIREANEYIRGRIRTDAAGLPLVDGCQWWTDGSADPQQDLLGWAAVGARLESNLVKNGGELLSSKPVIEISQRLPDTIGTAALNNGYAEAIAIT